MANPSSARAGRPVSASTIEAAPARVAKRRSRRDNLLSIAASPGQDRRNDVLTPACGQWLSEAVAAEGRRPARNRRAPACTLVQGAGFIDPAGLLAIGAGCVADTKAGIVLPGRCCGRRLMTPSRHRFLLTV